MKHFFSIIIFLSLISMVSAQSKSAEKSKFIEIIRKAGLSEVISFHKFETTDKLIVLKLRLNYSNSEKNCYAWNLLKENFKKKYSKGIENYLFFQYINIYKISELEKATIIIRSDFSSDAPPKIAIHFNENSNKIDIIEEFCMGEVEADKNIKLKNVYFLNENLVTKHSELARDVIYVSIKNNLMQFYQKGGFEKNSKPIFYSNFKRGNSELKFTVKGLKQEVLYDRANHFICNVMKFLWQDEKMCDWRSEEQIRVTINYKYDSDTKQTMIHLSMEARYGSGPHGTNKWKNMKDLDPTFITYLDEYKEELMKQIEKILTENN